MLKLSSFSSDVSVSAGVYPEDILCLPYDLS